MNTEILEEIGLTKSEIKVYLALLDLGSTTTGKIVEKSKASSSKIYEILEKLIQKGLASFIVRSGVKYFEAAPPKSIMDYMKEKEEKIQKQKDELKDMMPELELKQKLSKYKSEATIFKGMKGQKTAMDDVLGSMKKGEEYYVMGATTPSKVLLRFYRHYHTKRAKKGVKVKLLFSKEAKEYAENMKGIPLTEIKFAPEQLLASSFMLMYKDKTLITVPTKNDITLFRIENKEATDSFRSQFELLWNQKVHTYEGQDAVESAYSSVIEESKADDEVIVFAAKPTTKRGADFNTMWNREIRKKVKDVKLLYYGDNPKNRDRAKEIEKQGCKIKIYPTKETLPMSTVVAGDKVLNSVWGKHPTVFEIKDKTVADSLRANFNLLWNQDVTVEKGVEGVYMAWNRMLDEINPGERYYVLGASWQGQKKQVYDFFTDFHNRRIEKRVKAKFLFTSGTEQMVERYKKYYKNLGEVKFLPKGVYEGMQINLYKNKVLMFVWREKGPVVFTIEDKTAYQTFKSYFDSLWISKA